VLGEHLDHGGNRRLATNQSGQSRRQRRTTIYPGAAASPVAPRIVACLGRSTEHPGGDLRPLPDALRGTPRVGGVRWHVRLRP